MADNKLGDKDGPVATPVTPPKSRLVYKSTTGDCSESQQATQQPLTLTLSSQHDQGYEGGDEGFDTNLFDYLVHSTISKMDPRAVNYNTSLSSLHSSGSKNRRRPRQLRVKRYTGGGDEVVSPDDTTLPESHTSSYQTQSPSSSSSLNYHNNPSNNNGSTNSIPEHYQQQYPHSPSRSSLHSNLHTSGNASLGGSSHGSRNSLGRIKRHPVEILSSPPTIVSSGSDDDDSDEHLADLDDAAGSFPSSSPRRSVMDTLTTDSTDDDNTRGPANGTTGGAYTFQDNEDSYETSPPRPLQRNPPSVLGMAASTPSALATTTLLSTFPPDEVHEGGSSSPGQQLSARQTTSQYIQYRSRLYHNDQSQDASPFHYVSSSDTGDGTDGGGSTRYAFNDVVGDASSSAYDNDGALIMPPVTPINPFDTLLVSTTVAQDRPMPSGQGKQEKEVGPSLAQATMMASLASAVASKRTGQQMSERIVETSRATTVNEPTRGGIVAGNCGRLTREEEEHVAVSKPRKAELNQRRTAALAIATAARQQRDSLTHREPPVEGKHKLASEPVEPSLLVQLKKTLPKPQETRALGDEGLEPKRLIELKPIQDQKNGRSNRRRELEHRKRELEALAKAASVRREQQQQQQGSSAGRSAESSRSSLSDQKLYSYPPSPQTQNIDVYTGDVIGETGGNVESSRSSLSDKKLYAYPPSPQTQNIDVYTGDVIGEMPEIRILSRREIPHGGEGDDEESESEYSITSYDVPMVKGHQHRRNLFIVFLLLGIGLGVYFGAYFDRDSEETKAESNNGQNSSLVVESPAPSSVTIRSTPTSPTNSPTVKPTFQPSTAPSGLPAVPLIENVDSGLYQFLLDEWPSLKDSAVLESSPQRQALEWLTQDSGLQSYSDERRKQRFALVTLFYSTNGQNWTNNDGWLTDSNECTWYSRNSATRSQCQNGFYVDLKLDLNGLSGTIPGELGLLSNSLKLLDFTRIGNDNVETLTGSIPSELGWLSRLELVNLKGNQLDGALPAEIGYWTQLSTLNLLENSLSGELPSEIGLLTGLADLNLEQNLFSGVIPSEVGNLRSLRALILTNNKIGGPIPTEVGRLRSLERLSAAQNEFTLIPSEIGNLFSAQSISIATNSLGSTIPTELGQLSNLLALDISGNELNGPIPTTLGALDSLRDVLDLSENRLAGPIPTEFGRLLLLRSLLLHDNELTGELPASFNSLGQLNTLRLESNNLTGEVPDSVCAAFGNSFPVFVSDCLEMTCICCSFCCVDDGDCECQFANTGLSFLCIEGLN